MRLNTFASRVTRDEGLKTSVSVAQVKEILRIVNEKLEGSLYRAVREIEE